MSKPVSKPPIFRNTTPYRVICPVHKGVCLTEAQYDAQMDQPDSVWRCPVCERASEWDDDWFEEHMEEA